MVVASASPTREGKHICLLHLEWKGTMLKYVQKLKGDFFSFSEQRMLTAEETVCNQEANMQKLMHELESKDAELEELVMNIEEMESRGVELEGLVQLLEVRKRF